MNPHASSVLVAAQKARRRLLIGLPFFVAFGVAALLTDDQFFRRDWFYVGVVLYVSAAVLEPIFAGAKARLGNSLGALAGVWTVEHSQIQIAWIVAVAIAALMFSLSGLLFLVPTSSHLGSLLRRFTAMATARVLGLALLLLEVAGRIAEGDLRFVWLCLGALVLYAGAAAISLRRFQYRVAPSVRLVDVIGPRLGLLSSADLLPASPFKVGADSEASVIAVIPGARGPRAVVAFNRRWDEVAAQLPSSLKTSTIIDPPKPTLGIAGEGTSARWLDFEAAAAVELGEVVSAPLQNGSIGYYQIGSLRLKESSWGPSKYVSTQVGARALGALNDGKLALSSSIPMPHSAVQRVLVSDVRAEVPATHFRLGVLKGTAIEIGLSRAARDRGHMAVLGMTGMGKSSVVVKICSELGRTQSVIAIDPSGDYLGVLGGTLWPIGDFDAHGFHVSEPMGVPATHAKDLIEDAMAAARTQYFTGTQVDRLICYEEAHVTLPEPTGSNGEERSSSLESARHLLQSRKYGIGYLLVSQRTSVLSKSALGQCESFIVFRTADETALSHLEASIGPGVRDQITSLQRHEALCYGPAFNSDGPVIVSLDAPI